MNQTLISTANVHEAPKASDIVFTGVDSSGRPYIDWFPTDMLAALDAPQNADFSLITKYTIFMDNR